MKIYTYEIELNKYKMGNVIEKEFDDIQKDGNGYWVRYTGHNLLDFEIELNKPILSEIEDGNIYCYINTLDKKDMVEVEEYLKNEIGKYISKEIDGCEEQIRRLKLKFKCCQ